jgi:pimeloyl-ACP methyl ester carboxylesterase
VQFEIEAADGTRCLGWHWPAPDASSPPVAPWWLGPEGVKMAPLMQELRAQQPALGDVDVLLFHGNAGDRSSRLGWMHLLREGLGVSVTVVDYRGYGGSDGRPTEQGLIQVVAE